MNKSDTAEAIIVVGPFLWKCVNCNILLSREHSIDDHLESQHKSSLSPSSWTSVKCKLLACDCHKSPQLKKNKQKSRRRDTILTPDQNKTDQSFKCDSSETLLGADKESPDLDEGKDVGHVNDDSLPQCELNSAEREVENLKANEEKENNEDSSCTPEEGEEEAMNPNEENHNDVESCVKQSTHPSPNEEENIISSSEETVEKGVKRVLQEEESQSIRKSRRSNKGKNSLYQEFQMGSSTTSN